MKDPCLPINWCYPSQCLGDLGLPADHNIPNISVTGRLIFTQVHGKIYHLTQIYGHKHAWYGVLLISWHDINKSTRDDTSEFMDGLCFCWVNLMFLGFVVRKHRNLFQWHRTTCLFTNTDANNRKQHSCLFLVHFELFCFVKAYFNLQKYVLLVNLHNQWTYPALLGGSISKQRIKS